jgi:hypothetical protein
VIALIAVAFVLVPRFRDAAAAPRATAPKPAADRDTDDDAVGALREIEFDRATGKLSDADYTTLKSRYTAEALDVMRAAESEAATTDVSDLAEEAILRYRQRSAGCVSCGPRPEPDALYCSTCGRYLPGRCNGCGAVVNEPAARFCTSCGKTLAA